jgi:glutamine amidotransferase
MKATIVNYGMGNLMSLQNALLFLNLETEISSDPETIAKAELLFLPGVGSFNQAMLSIERTGIKQGLNKAVLERGVPILGICLGMQLIASQGEEDGVIAGLDWIAGDVISLNTSGGLRLPHVGFNEVVQVKRECALFDGIENSADFYFVHSYQFKCAAEENVVGISTYGQSFVSVIGQNNIWGVQFHPEKSQQNGLKLLSNFVNKVAK